jgi:hypothetical protein
MDSDNAGCVSRSMDDSNLTYSTLANSPAELLGSGQSCRNGCVPPSALSKFPLSSPTYHCAGILLLEVLGYLRVWTLP